MFQLYERRNWDNYLYTVKSILNGQNCYVGSDNVPLMMKCMMIVMVVSTSRFYFLSHRDRLTLKQ